MRYESQLFQGSINADAWQPVLPLDAGFEPADAQAAAEFIAEDLQPGAEWSPDFEVAILDRTTDTITVFKIQARQRSYYEFTADEGRIVAAI